MKNILVYLFVITLLLPWQIAAQQDLPSALLIPSCQKQDEKRLYQIMVEKLGDDFGFFHLEEHQKQVRKFYQQNPDIHSGDLLKRAREFSSVATDVKVVVTSKITTVPYGKFIHIFQHQAEVTIKILNTKRSGEVLASLQGNSGKILLPLPAFQDWTEKSAWSNHSKARKKVLTLAIDKIVPQLKEKLSYIQERASERRIQISAEGLTRKELEKLNAILGTLEEKEMIKREQTDSGQGSFSCDVIFPQNNQTTSLTPESLQEILTNESQVQGLAVKFSLRQRVLHIQK